MVRGASQGASTRLRSVSTSSRSFAFFLLSFIAFKANHSLADRRRRDEYGFECGLVRTPGTTRYFHSLPTLIFPSILPSSLIKLSWAMKADFCRWFLGLASRSSPLSWKFTDPRRRPGRRSVGTHLIGMKSYDSPPVLQSPQARRPRHPEKVLGLWRSCLGEGARVPSW